MLGNAKNTKNTKMAEKQNQMLVNFFLMLKAKRAVDKA